MKHRETRATPPSDVHVNVNVARVARSTALVASLLAIDKVLGVVREMLVSRAFGTSAVLDAYFAAFEIPEGLNTVVTGAALTTAMIPILTRALSRQSRIDLWRLVSTVVNWILISVGGASIVAAIFARPIMVFIAPGFAGDAAQVALSTQLMRLVLIQTLIFSASTVVTSVLQAHEHFLLPALSPLFYTLGRIFGVAVLAPEMGIFGLAWGGLLGAVAHLLVKVPWLIRHQARWSPSLSHPELGALLKLMAPRMLGMGVTYVNFVLPTTFGSFLPDGAISAYEYAWKLMQLPETLLGTAMGVVVFPTLSRLADEAYNTEDNGGGAELRRTFSWALRLILALSVPAAVVMLLIGRPLTALLYQGGAFDAAATDHVYLALQFFALGLVTHSALEVVARLFYARRDMWTPLWAALGGLLINATLSWTLLSRLAQGAIALGNSVGVGFQVAALLLIARRRLGDVDGASATRSLMRTLAAAGLMGIAMVGLHTLRPDPHGLERLLVGGGVYVFSALLLGSDELRQLPRLLFGK